MNNLSDLFKTAKFDQEQIIGENKFFLTSSEVVELQKSKKRFLPNVLYSNPSFFVKFGSAEEYYKTSINYINDSYPWAGSLTQKLEWENSLTDFDYYLFKSEYPRTVAHIKLSSSQYVSVPSFATTSSIDLQPSGAFAATTTNNLARFLDLTGSGFTYEAWIKNNSPSGVESYLLNLNSVVSGASSFDTVEALRISCINNHFHISGNLGSASFDYEASLLDWNHYAFSIKNENIKLYVNGQLTEQKTISPLSNVYKYAILKYGFIPYDEVENAAAVENFGNREPIRFGSGSAYCESYFDNVRFWSSEREVEEIGRNWFTNVNGNDFSVYSNNNILLVNYLFHPEFSDYSSMVLDYSGFENHAEIKNKGTAVCMITSSAIDESGITSDTEKPDVIIAPSIASSATLTHFYDTKIQLGKDFDEDNIHAIYKKFPAWILEEEESLQVKHLKQLTQIIAVYFDDLYNKITELSKLKHVGTNSDTERIYPFYDTILSSTGFDVKELFDNLNIIEKLGNRQEQNLFNEDSQKTKNIILQNIYNNLIYILKSKGTEKSIRSFLKAYGVNENLVRLNLYADKSQFRIQDRASETTVKKKTILLKNNECIYLTGSNPPTRENLDADTGYAFTLESCFSLPPAASTLSTNSLFGIVGFVQGNTTLFNTTASNYSVLCQAGVDNSYVFSLATGENLNIISSSSAFYQDIFDNTNWNLTLKVYPNIDTLVRAGDYNYIVELSGCNGNTANYKSFCVSGSINSYSDDHYRIYLGAFNQNLGINNIAPTYQKVVYCNFWNDYLLGSTVEKHNKDITNYGFE